MILATDMASHKKHLDSFSCKINNLGISKEKGNGKQLIASDDKVERFESKL